MNDQSEKHLSSSSSSANNWDQSKVWLTWVALIVIGVVLSDLPVGKALDRAFTAIFGFVFGLAGLASVIQAFKHREQRLSNALDGVVLSLCAVQLLVNLLNPSLGRWLGSWTLYIFLGVLLLRLLLKCRKRRKTSDLMASLQTHMIGTKR